MYCESMLYIAPWQAQLISSSRLRFGTDHERLFLTRSDGSWS